MVEKGDIQVCGGCSSGFREGRVRDYGAHITAVEAFCRVSLLDAGHGLVSPSAAITKLMLNLQHHFPDGQADLGQLRFLPAFPPNPRAVYQGHGQMFSSIRLRR